MKATIIESSTGRHYFRSDGGDLLWLGGKDREEAIATFSSSHPDIRLDYNPNQPRDARGRWRGGGGGGGRGGGGIALAPRKSGGGGSGGDLSKKKLTDLEAIAKEVGAAVPTKFKNRKSSWIAEIEKARGKGGGDTPPKPPVTPKPRYTPDELSKKKLTDLEALAKEVGAAVPAKFKNRKSSWIAEIEKAQGNKPSLPSTPPKVPKARKSLYKAKSFTHTELKKSGESFAEKHLKKVESKPSAKELKLKRQRDEMALEMKAAAEAGDFAKIKQMNAKFQEVESKHFNLQKERLNKELKEQGFENLEKAITKQSAITRKEAEAMADGVSLDASLSAIEATYTRDVLIDFFEMTGGRGKDYLMNIKYDEPRAYATRDGYVNIGDGSRATLFHEFAHHAEFNSEKLLTEAISWRNSRATSTVPKKLSEITGGSYGDDEIAVPGKFISPYVGRVYGNGSYENATEVISVGMEHFSSPDEMKKFKEKDPDHFHFILGVLTNNES